MRISDWSSDVCSSDLSDVYMNGKLSDTLAASFTGAYTKRGGIGNFVNLDTNREVGENRDFAGRLAVKWQANDDFSLLVAVDANDGEGGLRPYTTLIDRKSTRLNSSH